jgi:hypothetical protein
MAGIDFSPQIPFDMQHQQGDFLCWIAVAVSVKHHFESSSQMRQCGLVKALITGVGSSCCTASNGVRKKCDQEGALDDALDYVSHLAADTAAKPNPFKGIMKFADVQAQIDEGLPICAYIAWSGNDGDGHFILISGYLESGGTQYLYVEDPLYDSGPQPYDRVVSNYNLEGGAWGYTYRLKA